MAFMSSQVLTIYAHEVRSAFRERNIVIYSIVLPLVMYPVLLWAIFAGIQFVQGQTDRLESRVALVGLPDEHRALADSLDGGDRIEVVPWDLTTAEAVGAIGDGRLDVLVEFAEPDSRRDAQRRQTGWPEGPCGLRTTATCRRWLRPDAAPAAQERVGSPRWRISCPATAPCNRPCSGAASECHRHADWTR